MTSSAYCLSAGLTRMAAARDPLSVLAGSWQRAAQLPGS
jgi:hypothetical protein